MKTSALVVLGLTMLAASSAQADVFSSQSFDGGTTTLDNLPGVNLDAAPGFVTGAGNCTEGEVPAFAMGNGAMPTRGTTCNYGNFSITTTGSTSSLMPGHDLTYGGNPPPWVPNWRP